MIPITIVDDFLDEPEQLVEFADRLEYHPCPKGNWPGSRSEKLHELAPPLYENLTTRIMGLFQSLDNHGKYQGEVDASMQFQRVPAKSHHGWVHHDNCFATGILYLNDNAGTTLYKRTHQFNEEINPVATKQKSNLRGYLTEPDKKVQEEFNSCHKKEVVVAGLYNRLLMFHGNILHSANSFEREDEEDRLTLVMFFHRFYGEAMPLQRMRAVRKV